MNRSVEEAPVARRHSQVPLSWHRGDIEERFFFRGGKFTRVNSYFSLLIGIIFTISFYALLIPIGDSTFARMFTDRGSIPYAICFFSAWAFAILIVKWRKLALQRKALRFQVVPPDRDFVLSAASADVVMEQIHNTVDDPKHFVLFNRIVIALSNLRNLGRVGDVDDILRSQSEHDESVLATSYSLINGFVWAIPVLGFIGTVIGLSAAIGAFGGVLETAGEISEIKTALQGVTGGLAIAFETTLEALVAALFIQLGVTFLKKAEEEFMDACTEYCVRNIVNKLRLMPYQDVSETSP